MDRGSNKIYGLHVIIHNELFVECEVLENLTFENFVIQVQGQEIVVRIKGQKLVNWSSRIIEDKDFPQGQH